MKFCLKISLPLCLHPWSSVQQAIIYIANYIREIHCFWAHLRFNVNREITGQTKLVLGLTCIMNEMFSFAITLNILVNQHCLTWFYTTNTALQEIKPDYLRRVFFSLALFTCFIQLPCCTPLHWFFAPFHTIAAFRSNWNVRIIYNIKKKSWKSVMFSKNNQGWEFTKTIIPSALVGYELIW